MRILLSGASGLIGTALKAQLAQDGHEISTLVRREPQRGALDNVKAEFRWDPNVAYIPEEALDWADAVIGLSGSPLGKLPWTQKVRKEILSSRVNTTRTLALGIARSANPPHTWINGSAVGYYGNRPGELLTESAGPGSGFLAGICSDWEREARPATDSTRVVLARTGIVLDATGQLKPLMLAAKFGMATTFGSGEQYWPWVSLADEVNAIVHLVSPSCEISGPVNIVGPQGATAAEITQAFADSFSRPNFLRVPAGLMKSIMKDPVEDLLLVDQHVVPQTLADDGFEFTFPDLKSAVDAATGSNN